MMLAYRLAYAKQFFECFRHVAAKIVPKLLNLEQKERRVDIAQEILITFNNDSDLLKKVITGDHSWVYDYDIETKAQLFQWKRPEETRSRKASSSQMCRFCSLVSPITMDYNKKYYLEVMSQLL